MERIARRILNIDGLNNLEKEIDQLDDTHEKANRTQLLDAILDKIIDYDTHILNYEYKQHLITLSKRGLEVVAAYKDDIVAQWDGLFASRVSEQLKKQTRQYSDQFKWHIFSFDLLEALKSDEARGAFDGIQKDTVYLFFQSAEESFEIRNASLLHSEDLDFNGPMDKADIYVFDPVEKWTYVKTHEDACGPYFYWDK